LKKRSKKLLFVAGIIGNAPSSIAEGQLTGGFGRKKSKMRYTRLKNNNRNDFSWNLTCGMLLHPSGGDIACGITPKGECSDAQLLRND
jgi:hypothetical protein